MIDPEVKKVSATADTFVHYLFATPLPPNEQMLLSFVNAVRENAGQPPVKATHVSNPFNRHKFATDKRAIIDIKAIADNNYSFVIEFQVANHRAFAQRALYYWAKTYSEQIIKGDRYIKLMPVVMMIVTRFALFEEHVKLHNEFRIMSQNDPKFVFTDDLQIHTMELVASKLDQLPTMPSLLRQWLEFFYYADQKSEVDMKELLQGSDPAVQQAYDEYLLFNQSKELRQLEDDREKFLHDYNTEIQGAKEEGIAQGHAQGVVQGVVQGVAKSLLRTLTKRFQAIPQPLEAQILAITDLECLEKLADFALDCKSLDEFATAVK